MDMQIDGEKEFRLDRTTVALLLLVILAIGVFLYIGLRLNYEISHKMDQIIKLDERINAIKAKLPDSENREEKEGGGQSRVRQCPGEAGVVSSSLLKREITFYRKLSSCC